jgi:hypothetical protein
VFIPTQHPNNNQDLVFDKVQNIFVSCKKLVFVYFPKFPRPEGNYPQDQFAFAIDNWIPTFKDSRLKMQPHLEKPCLSFKGHHSSSTTPQVFE